MKALIVGAGGTTRELLRGLGEAWDVTVVDPDVELLARAAAIRNIVTVAGDGSSRVVLARADLDEAHVLVAVMDDDDVNLEACRLAQDAGVIRILAAAADPDRLGDYRELRVTAFAADRLAARRLELSLEKQRVTSGSFADGKAEAVEVRLAAGAPVEGKTLAEVRSNKWLVASIVRTGELIIPHGATRLEADDLVTVVGAAADYSLIVRAFTTGEARFPIEYGRQVAVALETERDLDGPVAEAAHLVLNSSAESLLLVHRDPDAVRDRELATNLNGWLDSLAERFVGVAINSRTVTDAPRAALTNVAPEASIGVVVVPGAVSGSDLRRRLAAVRLLRRFADLRVPVLFARSDRPYQSIVVPAIEGPDGLAAARAAVDLAAAGRTPLVGVATVQALPGPGGAREGAVRAAARLREEAAAVGVSVRRRVRRGSLVRHLEEEAADSATLLVLPAARPAHLLQPGPAALLLARSPASVLLLPEAA